MLTKQINITIVVLLALLVVPHSAPSPVSTVTPDLETDAFTYGSLGGVNWAYGTNTYTASGNASRVDEGNINESYNRTTVETRDVDLLISANYSDAYFRIQLLYTAGPENRTEELWFNSTGFDAWVNNVNYTLALANDPVNGNLTYGQELLALNITEAYSLEEAVIVDQFENFLGTTYVNSTYFEYNFLRTPFIGAPFWVRVTGLVYARAIILDVVRETNTLEVTRTQASFAYLGYRSEFARAYNISAKAHQVVIDNGENIEMTFNMFDSIEANYTEYVVTYMQYYFLAYDVTWLKYANGTDVSWENYPRYMLPAVYQTNGTIIEAGYNQVQTKMLSTFQGVTAAFATVDAEANDTSASIQARLAVWGVQMGTNLVAFEDGNGDGKLNLGFDRDGLQVASDDRVTHIGLTEAYETSVFSARYRSHVYDESLEMVGAGVNEIRTGVNDTSFDWTYDAWSIGDVNANTTATFSWTDPTLDTDGTVRFDFGVTYTNFPVTWISTYDGTATIDSEDIAYNYKVAVNPGTGLAKISPTWTYGGITDPVLQAEMVGKSLATIVKSEFFAVQASYTATETNTTLNSTSSSSFAAVGVRVGNGTATEIDVTGPKQFYTLDDGTNNTAQFDVINLVQVAGHFSGERTSAFESESDATAGTASNGVVETLTVDFFYSASLIVISYPAWGGQGVVHDPDYNVNYAPKAEATSSSTPTTPTTTTTTPTSTTASDSTTTTPVETTSEAPVVTDTPVSPAAPSPGFAFFGTIVAMAISVVLLRRRKN